MTLITVAQGLAKNIGTAIPATIFGNQDRTAVEILQFANEAGQEIARRVDWGAQQKVSTLTGTGAAVVHSLPADFSRLQSGACVLSGAVIVRPLSKAEFTTLTPGVGTPRYFMLANETLQLWPYLASGATVKVHYVSSAWNTGGDSFAADTNVPFFGDDLLLKGLIVRWRRQKGMSYQDEEAEYEAALADLARFEDRSRF